MKAISKVTIILCICALLAIGCTDSCYKDEDNFADAAVGSNSNSGSGQSTSPDGCQVGEAHYPTGMANPDNPCLVCAYLEDGTTKGWVPMDDGAWCNDDKYCTGEGVCDAGRCRFGGNPCPYETPYCYEAFGGVCSADPADDDDYTVDDDDDDDDNLCWVCQTSAECAVLLGPDWGCLNGCCEYFGNDDDDDAV